MTTGERAPNFTAHAPDGQAVALPELRGRRVLLFFDPKDSSLGCSIEARGFETRLADFDRLGVTVVGASMGDEKAQAGFREKCGLSFPLVSDPGRAVARAYGVLGPVGSLFGMTSRTSFLIGPDGRIERVWANVNPNNHAQKVLAELSTAPATAGA
ncbi:MAG TPA: peroxiredoxin [Deinococcales bacterium]|nr:peroxiredoxin [Deinococcales bacterium]